jgi:primary-amine oxidase
MATSYKSVGAPATAFLIFAGCAYLLLSLLANARSPTLGATSATQPRKPFSAPALNAWAEIDEAEASQIYVWLNENVNFFGTKDGDDHAHRQHVPYIIELLRPNKSDVVEYLDNEGPEPARWARLSVSESKGDEAYLVEYQIGPLPPSSNTQLLPLTHIYNSARNYVQTPVPDVVSLLDWAMEIAVNNSDITLELLGKQADPQNLDDPDGLVAGARPALIETGRMVLWYEFFAPGMGSDARSILPQGLYVKLDIPSSRRETWLVGEWLYNGVIYDNDTMLREAMLEPGFDKVVINHDGHWTDTEEFETVVPERNMLPPLSVQPFGPRYQLDRDQKYISWMGFSFYVSTSQATALSLFDIRYDGQRLIYHLGLQEALAHYAGVEPMQSGLEFLDTFFGMGKMMFSLVPGVDCPGHAEYIDMSYHRGGKMWTNKNAICIFEYTSDAPLQRHTTAFSATVSRNTYLVVRSVSTVGNYDYTVSSPPLARFRHR